jgi:hypothetical protein
VLLSYPILVATTTNAASTWPCIAVIMLSVIVVTIIWKSVASTAIVVVVAVPIIVVVAFPIIVEIHLSPR